MLYRRFGGELARPAQFGLANLDRHTVLPFLALFSLPINRAKTAKKLSAKLFKRINDSFGCLQPTNLQPTKVCAVPTAHFHDKHRGMILHLLRRAANKGKSREELFWPTKLVLGKLRAGWPGRI